jgi:hypothetical protein
MKAELLHVVTVYFNPVRWESRLRLTKEHLTHLVESGVRPTLVECALGERPFEFADFPGINHVGVRSKTLLWNKESLLRIGMQRLPDPDWKYVAWTDADIYFRKPNWGAETVHALQQYDIVQPWSDAYDLGPGDGHLAAYKSFTHQYWHGKSVVWGVDPANSAFERKVRGISVNPDKANLAIQTAHPGHVSHTTVMPNPDERRHNKHHKKHHHHPHDPHDPTKCPGCGGVPCYCPPCPPCPPPYYGLHTTQTAARMPWWKRDGGPHEYPHTGYAWAARRSAIDSLGGLFDIAAMGAGDYHMALALVGYADRSMPGKVHPSYRKHLLEWEQRAIQHVNFNLGYVPGTIEHSFHGAKGNRRYIDRWQIILEHDYDPDIDIQRNSYGVIELRCTKPGLRHDLDVYLRERNEDANIL